MKWILAFTSIALLIVGLVGQAFEMRKIRISNRDEELASASVFLNKKNFKWYALIVAGMILWYVSERI